MKVEIWLFGTGIDKALKDVQEYKKWLQRKTDELAKRLAEHGVVSAKMDFSRAFYQGIKDVTLDVTQIGPSHYKVEANGESVLFLEYGAGWKYGYGHPEQGEFGPGTWPDKHFSYNSKGEKVANWENDRGWYLPKEKGGGHTMGNPPSAAMYNAVKNIKEDIEQIVREVFND